VPGNWPKGAGDWPKGAGDWPKGAGDWPKGAGDWPKGAGDWPKGADDWPKGADDWPKLMLYNSCYQQKKYFHGIVIGNMQNALNPFWAPQEFLHFCNRQQQKRAKPPLGTTGVPTLQHI
jgi:hypothetical protein